MDDGTDYGTHGQRTDDEDGTRRDGRMDFSDK